MRSNIIRWEAGPHRFMWSCGIPCDTADPVQQSPFLPALLTPSSHTNKYLATPGPVAMRLIGVWAGLVLPWVAMAADYRDDIGHVALVTELGSATPSGIGVPVSHVEAPGPNLAWMPDIGNAEFLGKTIRFQADAQYLQEQFDVVLL